MFCRLRSKPTPPDAGAQPSIETVISSTCCAGCALPVKSDSDIREAVELAPRVPHLADGSACAREGGPRARRGAKQVRRRRRADPMEEIALLGANTIHGTRNAAMATARVAPGHWSGHAHRRQHSCIPCEFLQLSHVAVVSENGSPWSQDALSGLRTAVIPTICKCSLALSCHPSRLSSRTRFERPASNDDARSFAGRHAALVIAGPR